MTTERSFLLADRQHQGPVHAEGHDGRPSDCCQADETDSFPKKVVRPGIASRIEESHLCAGLWIHSGLTGGFAERTRDAGQREILRDGASARLHREDVVDMERGLLAFLRQAAVLAVASGSSERRTARFEAIAA